MGLGQNRSAPGASMVALLTHLKMFQRLGRFLAVRDLPAAAIAHVAKQIYMDPPLTFKRAVLGLILRGGCARAWNYRALRRLQQSGAWRSCDRRTARRNARVVHERRTSDST